MHQLLSLVWLRLALRGGKAEWREELLLDYTSSYAQFNGQFKFEAILILETFSSKRRECFSLKIFEFNFRGFVCFRLLGKPCEKGNPTRPKAINSTLLPTMTIH